MLSRVWRNLRRAFVRALRICGAQSQAVAFNLFLAYFPAMLFVFGVLTISAHSTGAVQELTLRLRALLPPVSSRLIRDYLIGGVANPWRWIGIGFGGMILVGLQVMNGLMQGFHSLHGDARPPSLRSRLGRALVMLSLMLGPWIAAVISTVFGRQLRGWMITQFGLPVFFRVLWLVVYEGLALVTATLVLACIYRLGRTTRQQWNQVLPGAVIATLLWWVVNTAFGTYVRMMPYSVVYGGLAAVIGMMVWMNVSVMVVFIGAAYNAVAAESASSLPDISRDPADTTPPAE